MKLKHELHEQDYAYYRELIWKNALYLFENKHNYSNNYIIKNQIKYINSFNLKGNNKNNKYKSVQILKNYFNNSNKLLAEQIFINTIIKKINI